MTSKKLTAGLVPLGLVAGVVAVAMAVLPAVASATTVTPAGAAAELEAKSNQTFTANNGTGVVVTCTAVTGTFTVPAEPNNSLAEGSVWTDFTAQPAYSGCSNNALPEAETVVSTNTTNGKWSIDSEDFREPTAEETAAQKDEAKGDALAIGVPKAGAAIEIGEVCTITVSPEEASAVIGSWHDGTTPTGTGASWARIKEQVNFSGCGEVGATPPAVYAGEAWVKNVTAGATEAIKF